MECMRNKSDPLASLAGIVSSNRQHELVQEKHVALIKWCRHTRTRLESSCSFVCTVADVEHEFHKPAEQIVLNKHVTSSPPAELHHQVMQLHTILRQKAEGTIDLCLLAQFDWAHSQNRKPRLSSIVVELA